MNQWEHVLTSNEIGPDDAGKQVNVAGWIQDVRNLGGVAFVLLRTGAVLFR